MKEFGDVIENGDLKKYNTYGIGGIARYIVYVDSIEHLKGLLSYLKENNIPWYVLGNGSNVILPDEDFAGVIIKLDKLCDYEVDLNIVKVSAGISLGNFITNMLDDGFVNYAELMGIPGLLGGAIIGNAGAYNKAIFDYLISVTILDDTGDIKEVSKEDIRYDYRYTEFKNSSKIVLSAKFLGIKGNVGEAKEKILTNMKKRKNTQPLEYKNAGSVFRNPLEMAAGFMIEQAGLKGAKVGGAMVSLKHANFIINYDNATSHDIIELIQLVRKKVQEQYGVLLELEQVIVKW